RRPRRSSRARPRFVGERYKINKQRPDPLAQAGGGLTGRNPREPIRSRATRRSAEALQVEGFAGEGVLHIDAPVGGGLVGVEADEDARAGLVVEGPAGPVELVLLDKREDVGRPGVRILVLVGSQEWHRLGL